MITAKIKFILCAVKDNAFSVKRFEKALKQVSSTIDIRERERAL